MGMLRLSDQTSVFISGPFSDAGDRIQSVIDDDQSGGSFGHTWEMAWGIVRSGLEWPGWEQYHYRFRSAYHNKLGGRPEHRDNVYGTEDERKRAMWTHTEIARGLSRNHYMPGGVQLPEFLEGPPARPSILRRTMERTGLPEEAAKEWFLKSFSSQRVQRGVNYDFTTGTWRILRHRGLVVGCDAIPLKAAVKILSLAEMRSVIKSLRLEPQRTLKGSREVIVAASESDVGRVLNALVSLCGFADFTMVQPPDGIDWMDFQSWRQQIRGMSEAMTDLSIGQVRQAYDRSLLMGH